MTQRVPITVRLDSFEGPLDLLLYLIQSHELDISKISIAKITGQYLGYIQLLQELNFDIASDFLVMAATLLYWKSRALLPQDDKAGAQEDGMGAPLTQEELIRQLLEHQRFLEAGSALSEIPRLGEEVFTRANRKPPIERIWRDMSLTDLALAYQTSLVRARKRTQILKKETVSLADKIVEFSNQLPLGELVEFSTLISPLAPRGEVVVTFLASLELARLMKLKVYQEETYSAIYLELIELIEGLDLTLASGFDAIEARLSQPAL